MSAIILNNGHFTTVRKSESTIRAQISLNKLKIADVLIDIIKDFLYISRAEVLKKYYKSSINNSITQLTIDPSFYVDIHGRDRLIHWAIGHIGVNVEVQIQSRICARCGEKDTSHNNLNGFCLFIEENDDEEIEIIETSVIDKMFEGIDINA